MDLTGAPQEVRQSKPLITQTLADKYVSLCYKVSTALWTGVYLADILDAVNPIRRRAKHVIFEGADKLPNGPYGTSQKLSWAKSKDKGMMIGARSSPFVQTHFYNLMVRYIAWAMNGAPLEPDHGFPVRLVVPGQIGGRSVKVSLRRGIFLQRVDAPLTDTVAHADRGVRP